MMKNSLYRQSLASTTFGMDSAIICLSLVLIASLAHSVPIGDFVASNTLNDDSTAEDYERLVDTQVKNNAVMLYTGSRCGRSQSAKELLDSQYSYIRYGYLDYDTAPGGDFIMGEVSRRANTHSLPYIFICGRYIGGTSALEQYHESGQLKDMIREC